MNLIADCHLLGQQYKPMRKDPQIKVQLFNDSVLGSPLEDSRPLLNSTESIGWQPRQIILDYKENECYGAMVHYDRKNPFETLREGLNEKYGKFEIPEFASDPEFGMWRVVDGEFAIQLTANENEESFVALYVCFVDGNTMAAKLGELYESSPELFDDSGNCEIEEDG